MSQDIERLLRLDREMWAALERDDLDSCIARLAARGELLAHLTNPGAPSPADPDLRGVLVEIRSRDERFAQRLLGARTQLGRRLADLKTKSRQDLDGTPPSYLDRHV